jgi:small subunit ribosomal protein S8
MVRDTISELITKIYNASTTGLAQVTLPYTKFQSEIAIVLEKTGYIKQSLKKGKTGKLIELTLIYEEGSPRIHGVKRLSKLSKRVYVKAANLHPVRGGFEHMIISTPKGVLTDKDAKTANVGGEPLFKIW